jgi:alanine racemase
VTRRIDRSLADADLPALERSAWVEVDVTQLTRNACALAELARPAALGAVVKADGYGHGLEMAGRSAVAGGATWLCVANASEAARLRTDGYQGRIFVLYPVPTASIPAMSSLEVDVTVGSSADIETAVAAMATVPARLRAHLEIDTGMTRGGVSWDRVASIHGITSLQERVILVGAWTHLAAPEEDVATRAQLERFETALSALTEMGIDPDMIHVAASGGLLGIDTSEHGMVRPGLAFYGVHPGAGHPLPGEVAPALAVKAHPVRIAEVPPGTRVGYAGTWVAPVTSRIATLPIGYADGWSRSSSPGGFALVDGARVPIVGRVSSDAITVDVSEVDGVDHDSEFTLLGRDRDAEITADEVAAVRDTLAWEVLQQLGARLARVYFAGGSSIAMRAESTTTTTGARAELGTPY